MRVERVRLDPTGAIHGATASRAVESGEVAIPDLLDRLGRRTQLSRRTLAAVLVRSGRIEDCRIDPLALIDAAEASISAAGQDLLGPALVAERAERAWKLRIADNDDGSGSDLELPGGFAVTTPLGAFRPSRATWSPGSLRLSRRPGPY